MIRMLRDLKRALDRRAARRAERIALVDLLGHPNAPDSPHHVTAWEALFARPEWKTTAVGHDGKCSRCGAVVAPDQGVCGACGAVWRQPTRRAARAPLLVFWSVALISSIGLSLTAIRLGSRLAQAWFRARYPGHEIDLELVGFVESYLLVSGVFVLLLLSTFVLERLDLAPKGQWDER